MIKNKELWMRPNEIEKEKNIISLLNDKEKNCTEKAKELGYKRQTVYLDGVRKIGWVSGEDLSFSVREIVKSRLRWPLGFDYYYWGNESFKLTKQREFKEGKITETELKKIFPNICMECVGSGWDRKNNSPCLICDGKMGTD